MAHWQARRVGGIGGEIDLAALVMLPDRDWLNERIERRFATMVDDGRDEAQALLARSDVPADAPVLRAIGIPELRALLAGEIDRDAAIAAGATATRQYAKRQYTWFRRQPPDHWHRSEETQTFSLIGKFETKLLD